MKKFVLAGVSLVALGFASGANAADSIMMQPNDIIVSNNQIIAEFIGTNLDYAEHGGNYGTATGLLDTEKGWVPGFGLKASAMSDLLLGNDYLEAEFSRSNGHTHYVGALIGGGPFGSVKNDDGATFTDLNARYGKGFALQANFMITPYAELGYHKWDRDVNQGETYTNFYVGGGALVQWSPVNRLVLSANAMVGGTFSSHIDVAGPVGFSDSLGNSAIYKLGVGVDYAMTKHLHLSAGLDYTDFKYGVSPLQSSGYFEPHSTTKITALKVGIGYAF